MFGGRKTAQKIEAPNKDHPTEGAPHAESIRKASGTERGAGGNAAPALPACPFGRYGVAGAAMAGIPRQPPDAARGRPSGTRRAGHGPERGGRRPSGPARTEGRLPGAIRRGAAMEYFMKWRLGARRPAGGLIIAAGAGAPSPGRGKRHGGVGRVQADCRDGPRTLYRMRAADPAWRPRGGAAVWQKILKNHWYAAWGTCSHDALGIVSYLRLSSRFSTAMVPDITRSWLPTYSGRTSA